MESQEERAERNIRSIAKSISELKEAMEALSPSERDAFIKAANQTCQIKVSL